MSNGDQINQFTQDQLQQLAANAEDLSGAFTLASLLSLLNGPYQAEPTLGQMADAPVNAAKQEYDTVYAAMIHIGAPAGLAAIAASIAALTILLTGAVLGAFFWALKHVGKGFVDVGLQFINAFRQQVDPDVAEVAVAVLNELMGTEMTPGDLSADTNVAGHLARAKSIGQMYIKTLTQELNPEGGIEGVDGAAGAARFTGMIVNFGVATALLGLIGEIGTGGWIKNFRLIGEQVSSGLGLSKQMRIAIKPLIKTLIATPYQWQLNKQFYPQRFSLAECVNPYTENMIDHDTIVADLALQGWSPDRAEKLIKLHSRKLTLADLEIMWRYSPATHDVLLGMIKELGYPEDLVQSAILAEDLRRTDTVMRTLVNEIELRVDAGQMTIADFSSMLDTLPLGPTERIWYLQKVQYKSKSVHNQLTLPHAEKALIEGIWTFDEFEAYLTARGYSADDVATLEQLTLLQLAKFDEAKKVAQFNWEKKVAAAKAKGQPEPPQPAILFT